jgi:CheY-like chemotaxis protein/HPt (histidine-containing phosphotransfer) domain-containing protein
MSDDVALLLAKMQSDFLDELPDLCSRLEKGVLALEGGVPSAFDELYRNIHSLKGAGGTFGLHIITTICHQFESFISGAKQRLDSKGASTALAYVDLLRKTILAKGRDDQGVAAIENTLEKMRQETLSGRVSVLMVDPSDTVRMLYQGLLDDKSIQLVILVIVAAGMEALGRMLHEPFDLLVISRELPDLNAIAVVAALRESRCRNSDIPVILVSSNLAAAPPYLGIRHIVRRDPKLMSTLAQHIPAILAKH